MMYKRFVSFFRSNFSQLLFALYFSMVWELYIFTIVADKLVGPKYWVLFLLIFIALFVIAYRLTKIIFRFLKKIKITKGESFKSKKQKLRAFLIIFFACLAVVAIWLLAYWPGAFSSDSYGQYVQASTGNYVDWHPVLHTFLFFTIPLKVFHSLSAVVVCQAIFFSLIVAYAIYSIVVVAGRRWGLLSFALIMLNPIVLDELMYPWKDVGFGILALLSVVFSLHIFITKGDWAKKTWKMILFGIVLACMSIFRHNGILFSLPLLVALFFFINWKQWVKLFVAFAAFFFIVKVPFYSILNVTPPDKRASETVGMPLTIIAGVVKNAPEKIDDSLADFVYSIAPQERWNECVIGNFNSIKWGGVDLSPVEEAGVFGTLKMSLRAVWDSPADAMLAFVKMSGVVYFTEGNTGYYIIPDTATEIRKIIDVNDETSFLKDFVTAYRKVVEGSILKYIEYVGVAVLAMVLFILGKCTWSKGGWKKILLCSPVLFYSFGTMFFLTGPETRFFYLNFLVWPIVIVITVVSTTITKSKLKS